MTIPKVQFPSLRIAQESSGYVLQGEKCPYAFTNIYKHMDAVF